MGLLPSGYYGKSEWTYVHAVKMADINSSSSHYSTAVDWSNPSVGGYFSFSSLPTGNYELHGGDYLSGYLCWPHPDMTARVVALSSPPANGPTASEMTNYRTDKYRPVYPGRTTVGGTVRDGDYVNLPPLSGVNVWSNAFGQESCGADVTIGDGSFSIPHALNALYYGPDMLTAQAAGRKPAYYSSYSSLGAYVDASGYPTNVTFKPPTPGSPTYARIAGEITNYVTGFVACYGLWFDGTWGLWEEYEHPLHYSSLVYAPVATSIELHPDIGWFPVPGMAYGQYLAGVSPVLGQPNVSVAPGQTTVLDLDARDCTHVYGQITADTQKGEALGSSTITFVHAASSQRLDCFTNEFGYYSVRLRPGSHTMTVTAPYGFVNSVTYPTNLQALTSYRMDRSLPAAYAQGIKGRAFSSFSPVGVGVTKSGGSVDFVFDMSALRNSGGPYYNDYYQPLPTGTYTVGWGGPPNNSTNVTVTSGQFTTLHLYDP
ncbi:MAG: carboxypeptidase regulatory-like domain-containing protein [Armatimonadetes bacterium]|nr:carboxypeptidase regulatory-like domain-containing protein [Armatimonadota bacterium]